MRVERFKNARELIDIMNAIDKRIWIGADDPMNRILKVVDEQLEHRFEISMTDLKNTGDLLSKKELECFEIGGKRWNLVKDIEVSKHQEFLLSDSHMTGMANYLAERYTTALDKSLLRVNSTVKKLRKEEVSILSIEPRMSAFCFRENGRDIVEVSGERMFTPLFEVAAYYTKKYESIWDVDIGDFVDENEICSRENEYYEKIIKELGNNVQINLLVNLPLVVLPASDWANSEMGFSAFEQIGIGIFKS